MSKYAAKNVLVTGSSRGVGEIITEHFLAEGATVIGDVRLPSEVRAVLAAQFDYLEARVQTMPMKFACPSAVARDGDINSGATEIAQPWADAIAA